MKRLFGIAAVVVLAGATLSFAAGSAVADGGASCSGGNGYAKFSPGLSTTASAENVVAKGTLSGCTGGTFTDAKFLVHLPAGAPTMTCDALAAGSPDSWTGSALVKWLPGGSPTSHATVTATLTGAGTVHLAGTITKGSFTGMALTTDLVLTAQFKTFPASVKTPPDPCSQKNRLKRATYSTAGIVIG